VEWIEVAEQACGHDKVRLCDGHRGAERVPDGNIVIRFAANAGHTRKPRNGWPNSTKTLLMPVYFSTHIAAYGRREKQ
jgi:hypothetical protein